MKKINNQNILSDLGIDKVFLKFFILNIIKDLNEFNKVQDNVKKSTLYSDEFNANYNRVLQLAEIIKIKMAYLSECLCISYDKIDNYISQLIKGN